MLMSGVCVLPRQATLPQTVTQQATPVDRDGFLIAVSEAAANSIDFLIVGIIRFRLALGM
jgi:hypothetical protein